ncbi:MAG: hypothetical protein FWD31_04620, partial [Planctomycetaceae bacterium]|nr:hypothetical protein [Planctomycetaceae bacterium]
MKKFDNNSMTTGCNAMTVFHGAGKNFHHQTRGLPCLFATVLILAGFAVSAFAQSVPTESAWFHDGQFWVDDENELEAAMDYLLPAGMTKIINFTGSVGVEGNKLYTLNNGETVILKLNGYNFMGNGLIDFRNPGTDPANLVIEGSTMQFNKGIHLNGNLVLTYQGIYTSGGTDYLRFFNPGITVNLTLPNSAWDAFNHNVIIGHDQASEFNMSSGNWAKSANVFIGGDIDPFPMTFGDGTLNIWGKATNWTNTKNLIVGAVGEGVLNLFDGALINTGNFGIGGNGGDGIANIYGAGTILNIFGSHSAAAITADGTAAMNVRDLARVFLRYNDKLDDG